MRAGGKEKYSKVLECWYRISLETWIPQSGFTAIKLLKFEFPIDWNQHNYVYWSFFFPLPRLKPKQTLNDLKVNERRREYLHSCGVFDGLEAKQYQRLSKPSKLRLRAPSREEILKVKDKRLTILPAQWSVDSRTIIKLTIIAPPWSLWPKKSVGGVGKNEGSTWFNNLQLIEAQANRLNWVKSCGDKNAKGISVKAFLLSFFLLVFWHRMYSWEIYDVFNFLASFRCNVILCNHWHGKGSTTRQESLIVRLLKVSLTNDVLTHTHNTPHSKKS